MKAIQWNGSGTLDVVDRPLPEPPEGWARLSVAACGICGSDLHGFRHGLPSRDGHQPGHEVAGYLSKLNADEDLDLGALYALEPIHSCGTCEYCLTGRYNVCRNRELIGVGEPGGLAEEVLVPAHRLHRLDAALDKHVAALAEPLAVCVRAARLGRIGYRGRVAIIGAGTIGLLCIPAVLAAGASEVFITARHPQQQEFARHLGATGVFADTASLLTALGDSYPETVIETVGGKADTLIDAAQLAAPGGTIIKLGIFIGTTPIPSLMFFDKELTLIGSNCYAFDGVACDFASTTGLLHTIADQVEPLVTHRFGLDDANRAFESALDKSTGSIKVQLRPG